MFVIIDIIVSGDQANTCQNEKVNINFHQKTVLMHPPSPQNNSIPVHDVVGWKTLSQQE